MSILVLGAKSDETGGVENMVGNLNMHLIRKGFKVTTLYMPRCSHKLFWSLKPFWSIQPFLRSLNLQFDLVHGHGDNCFFYSVFRKKRIPFLMTFHGTQYIHLRSIRHGNLMERLYFCLPEKTASKYCDLAVACSQRVKSELIRFYRMAPEKIRVIHNGVDTQRFKPMNKDEAREKLGLEKDKTYGLWVGKQTLGKGLDIAIRACKRANYELLVCGIRGKDTNLVHFLGKIPHFMMPYIYNAANFLLHPSRYEGHPIVCLEALACGLPIIVSYSSNVEIITEGVEGFIISDLDEQEYARKIRLLVSDPVLLRRMSENARKTAEDFCWENQAQKYIALYEELLQ